MRGSEFGILYECKLTSLPDWIVVSVAVVVVDAVVFVLETIVVVVDDVVVLVSRRSSHCE